jgi:hypothetical protein
MPISRIKTDGIQDDAITSPKIADDAITSPKIGVDVIVADDLAANSVTVSEITDGAVTGAKLANNLNYDSGTFYLDSTNNRVGIGTSSPESKLHINGSFRQTGATAPFEWTVNPGALDYYKLNSVGYADNLIVANSGGNVGIGTTSPQYKLAVSNNGGNGLEVRPDFSGDTETRINSYNRSGGSYTTLSFDTGVVKFRQFGTTDAVTIDSSGNLLVGATTARYGTNTLSLEAGNSLIWFQKQNTDLQTQVVFNRNTQGTSSIAGTIQTTGTTVSYNTSSDYRLKESVNYDFDATTRLKQLKPCRFNWIQDETDTTVDGFLAHEVQSVVPEAISGTYNEVDADGNAVMQGIDQSKLVPLLVKTIQELEARITELESR